MDLIQSSFQSSFNARVERLSDGEMTELRVVCTAPWTSATHEMQLIAIHQIFRFFDTDSDGAIAADQACRIFGMVMSPRADYCAGLLLTDSCLVSVGSRCELCAGEGARRRVSRW